MHYFSTPLEEVISAIQVFSLTIKPNSQTLHPFYTMIENTNGDCSMVWLWPMIIDSAIYHDVYNIEKKIIKTLMPHLLLYYSKNNVICPTWSVFSYYPTVDYLSSCGPILLDYIYLQMITNIWHYIFIFVNFSQDDSYKIMVPVVLSKVGWWNVYAGTPAIQTNVMKMLSSSLHLCKSKSIYQSQNKNY